MITIDEFEQILEELAEELPEDFYIGLNGGIVVDAGRPIHPEARNNDLCIMGQYRNDRAMGKYIVMFYGSFARVYGGLDEASLKNEMRRVLRHEFRHHLEGNAGLRDLEDWDEAQIQAYKKRNED